MTSEEATMAVIDALEAMHIPYMVVGSFSSSYYGIARSTKDADFVVEFETESLPSFMDHLGPAFRLDPQMTFETITMTRRHVLNVASIPFQIELFYLSEDPHDRERFERRRRVKLLDREINLPTAEDVIIMKTRWAWISKRRSKDIDDVRGVVAVQGPNLDWSYIYGWCDQHGTRALLDEIRDSIPPL